MRLLSADSKNTRNHTVQVLDIFLDDVDSDLEFLVTPSLRPFNDPPFVTVGEMLDFVRQTLEV
jgi:hypothetical protein